MSEFLKVHILEDGTAQVYGGGSIEDGIKLAGFVSGYAFNTVFGLFVCPVWSEFAQILKENGVTPIQF